MPVRGPIPRGEFQNKSRVLSTRIREDTRKALEEAAAVSGRSLSQEIEYRIRRSFDNDRIISEKFGSRQNYALLRLLASLFDHAPNEHRSWLHDPDNFNHVCDSIARILLALNPSAVGAPDERDQFFGLLNASAIADELGAADATMPPDDAGNALNFIKSDLGNVADRLKKLEGSGMGHGERARIRRRQK